MKKSTIILCLFLILGFLCFFWWKNGTSAVNTSDKTEKTFTVEKGQGIRAIANKLKTENLIKDPIIFFLVVKKQGLEGKIQAGDFRLSPSQTASQIAESLTHATNDIWVTIPEGKRAQEVADILEEKIPTFNTSWRKELVKHEGYLFPDTYLIPKDADIAFIISTMTNNFEKKFATITTNSQNKENIVIIASLIEREAKHAQDRPLISSVIHNRLKDEMALDIDATIQYALGYQRNEETWWKRHLTLDDLALRSPYNTYQTSGLPPTPICNPGLESLRAAVNPAQTNYYFYLADSKGNTHYAKTNEEHNANRQKYGL